MNNFSTKIGTSLARLAISALIATLLPSCGKKSDPQGQTKSALAEKTTPESLGPRVDPAPKRTPAQIEFWNYLEPFNRLPEKPSEAAIAVYNTKGIAPKFRYLENSKTSVFGDTAGLAAHRARFVKRYPWVQPLLEHYGIEVPIPTERFSGSVKEIGQKYEQLMLASHKCANTPANEKTFVSNYLEGLLVVDFIYACGTPKDKQEAIPVLDGVFIANTLSLPFNKALGASFMTPASRDIGWAVMADFLGQISGMTRILIRSGFSEYSPADNVNFCKWLLRIQEQHPMLSKNDQDMYRGHINNEQVSVGLLSYAIYCAHTNEGVDPHRAPGSVIIGILFNRLYPKDHAAQYQRYQTLFNAAYPKPTPKPTPKTKS